MFIWTLPLFCGGSFMFWWGFQHWKRAQCMEKTPTTPIAKLPTTGHVEVKGRVRAIQKLYVPETECRCSWFHLVVRGIQGAGRATEVVERNNVKSRTLLEVDDGTGRVRINPVGAEIVGLNPLDSPGDPATRKSLKYLFDEGKSGGSVHLRWIPENAKIYVLGNLRRTRGGGSILGADPEHPLLIRVGSESAQLAEEKKQCRNICAVGLAQFFLAALILI